MIRVHPIAAIGLSAAVLLLSFAVSAGADDSASKSDQKAVAASTAKSKPQLSPEMTALRDQVRQVLAAQQRQAFNTRQNLPTEIQSVCLAFGCDSEVTEGTDGKRINAITCLCWDYPCAGMEMLGVSRKHLAAHVGYGYQEHPGEFLAMLAMSRVSEDYPVRVGRDVRKVADLIEAEKLGCRSGGDASLKLIGLSYYVADQEWKNDLGETWSVGRMITDEIGQPIVGAPDGGLNRLLGLGYAVSRRLKRDQPLDGPFGRAQKYVADFCEYALRLQSADGSWGPNYLADRTANPDVASQLRSTGRVLEWLVTSLPDEKLTDRRLQDAVACVTRVVASERYQYNAPSLSTQEIVSLGHALHALNMYDQRALKPFDAPEKPAAEKQAPATASRNSEPTS
jgi:hypothetical protein